MLTAATCTINQMIACRFEGKIIDGWNETYIEWIDLSGLAATDEYSALVTIHNLTARIEAVPQYVKAQLECLKEFGLYHPVATQRLTKYGYKMPNDLSKAEAFLKGIYAKEKRYRYDLLAADDKLRKIREGRPANPEGNDLKKERRDFIKLLNRIGQEYTIDRDKTTVEELALMIAEQREQAAAAQIDAQFKKKP